MGGIFAISVAVFRSLFEGLKGHEKRPKIYQIDANSKDIHWVLKFLKSISHELNAEVGKVRHQKLEKNPRHVGFFSLPVLLLFSSHTMDP